MPKLLSLAQLSRRDVPEVGSKAANLGEMLRMGWPVPPGFCVPCSVYAAYLLAPELSAMLLPLEHRSSSPLAELDADRLRILRAAHRPGLLPGSLVEEIRVAYNDLLQGHGSSGLVAVRSSAVAEDTPRFSAAGLHESYLAVGSLEELLERLVQCWSSVWTPSALAYRQRMGCGSFATPFMAVVVQEFIPCEAQGVVFTVDPTSDAERMVVEASWGSSQAVVRGEAHIDRYVLRRDTLDIEPGALAAAQGPMWSPNLDSSARRPPISPEQLRRLGELAMQVETHFGSPQDIEWGRIGDGLFLLQSRPVTGRATPLDEVFTHRLATDNLVWTSGFVNERFPSPVSPLGWSLIREPLETLAMREPLRFIGADAAEHLPLTKLRHGHPYVNGAVFQALYRAFPRWLLPEDATRYFPNGNVALIRQGPGHGLFHPAVVLAVLRAAVRDPLNWSPWHNHRVWRRFLPRYERAIDALSRQVDVLDARPTADTASALPVLWKLVDSIQEENRRLLRYHRWSLTHADVAYSLLRRALVSLLGRDVAGEVTAHLLDRVPSRSREADDELRALSRALGRSPALKSRIAEGLESAEAETPCGNDEAGLAFRDMLRRYLSSYGHRSVSLDILRPPLRDDPAGLLRLALDLSEPGLPIAPDGEDAGESRPDSRADGRGAARRDRRTRAILCLLRPLTSLASVYLELREEQRFIWQKGLALLRRVFLLMGRALATEGVLDVPDDVFFLTQEELAGLNGTSEGNMTRRSLIAERRAQFRRLEREFELAPSLAYPPFLLGDEPLVVPRTVQPGQLSIAGVPVSVGRVRGSARVVKSARGLNAVRPGEILVTTSPDPGWTPVFGAIRGLVMEYGGQLSHGSVVAREYGLPAVARASMVTELLQDGDQILVDGYLGLVVRLAERVG